MAESIMRSDAETELAQSEEKDVAEPARKVQETAATHEPVVEHAKTSNEVSAAVIWTPRFIVIFALMLVLGLSADSLLVQARDNRYLAGNLIFLAHVALIFIVWVVLIVRVRSVWVRLGGIFGCIWAIFSSTNLLITLQSIDPEAPILAHLNAAFSSALLGCYICLSINRTPLRRWDSWFFSIAPFVTVCFVIVLFLLTPADSRSFSTIEDGVAGIANILSVLVWWSRPSCWKMQPGVTFLFGVAPLIILMLSIPGFANSDTNFFFWEIMLLCILLGAIRLLQGELRRKPVHA
jgi:hypothetical protein